jgi:hypothetical protein
MRGQLKGNPLKKSRLLGQEGQAAVEAIFSVLIILLFMLAAGQILYTSLISEEAVKQAHSASLTLFRKMNTNGSDLKTSVEESKGVVTVDPGEKYAQVVNGWSIFHKDYQPKKMPHADYSGGKQYEAKRGIVIAAGPLKGEGGVVDSVGEGRSAFGVERSPQSDGDGYNDSGKATRQEAFKELCDALGIENIYFTD